MRFLDANVFVRHLTNDHPTQSPASRAFFQAIDRGEITVWTTDVVIGEVVYVLSSRRLYGLARPPIRDGLLPLIDLPGIRLPNKRLYRRVFEVYTALPLDFPDAFHAALMGHRDELELYSFDTHFDRVSGIRRFEPTEVERQG